MIIKNSLRCAGWLLFAGFFLSCTWVHADLRVEVVDDTGTNPYLLLVGKGVAPTGSGAMIPMNVSGGSGQLAQVAADFTAPTLTATVISGSVTGVTVVAGGSAYYPLSATVPVTFTGGAPTSAATGTATVSGGVVTGVTVTNGGTGYTATPQVTMPSPSVTPLPVNQLQSAGYSVTSPCTGQSRPVYYFTINTLGSGAFMIFQNSGSGSPFVYSNNANPSPTLANYRFDQCEITFNAGIQSGANLTSIDSLSMPMQFELFTGTGPSSLTLVGERKFYASLSSILGKFPSQASGALYKAGATAPQSGWIPADGMGTFLRALGPGQAAAVTAANPSGSPSPYPSFGAYLKSLSALTTANQPTATASIAGGIVTAVSVATVGSYTSAPAVSFQGGGGSGAAATANVSPPDQTGHSQVQTVTVTNAGSGYATAPTVVFSETYGSGATANAMIGTGVTGISVGNAGSGFTTPPAVMIVGGGSVPGGGGTGAAAVATLTGAGGISGITVTQTGSGYITAPSVTFPSFNVSGSANGCDYNYAGNVLATSNGYQIVLNGTTYATNTGNPYAGGVNANGVPIPTNAQVTINLPNTLAVATATAVVNSSGVVTGITLNSGGSGYMSTPIVTIAGPPPSASAATATATATLTGDTVTGIAVTTGGSGYSESSLPVVTVNLPAGSMDSFIYGAALNGDSFAVQGLTPAQVGGDTNIVYGSVVRDVLAALNFGYLNGKLGNTGTEWFNAIPNDPPFGSARTTNDGFYNPWAALIYNYSDAYGFAFSDRINPSPLITLQDQDTLRITILPDVWLDAPRPGVTQVGNSTMDVSWNAVTPPAGCTLTGYTLTVLDPPGILPISLSANATSYTLGSAAPLSAGTAYTFTLSANGTVAGNPVSSTSTPVQASTTGAASVTSGNISFGMTLSYQPPPFLLTGPVTANVGGTTLIYQPSSGQWQTSGGLNAPLQGNLGANTYAVTVFDSAGNPIFATNASVNLTGSTGTITTNNDCSYFQDGSITVAGSGTGTLLTLILPPPSPIKLFAPVQLPGTGYNQWLTTYPGLSNTAPAGDPDGDSFSNLLEYFQGNDPAVAGLFGYTSVDSTPTQLVFSYRKSKTVTGVDEQVEWSSDLVTWQTTGVTFDPDEDFSDHIQRTARVALSGTKTFLHLKLTLTQP